jgi:hypothetical protein
MAPREEILDFSQLACDEWQWMMRYWGVWGCCGIFCCRKSAATCLTAAADRMAIGRISESNLVTTSGTCLHLCATID